MKKIKKVNNYLFVAFGFAFPISIALANTLIALITLLWLIEMDFKRKFQDIKANKLAHAIMIFLFINLLGLLYSPNIGIGKHIIGFYYILILFPIFLTTLEARYVNSAIFSFIVAMTISELASYSIYFGLFKGFVAHEAYATAFVGHLFYTPLLAISVFILLNQLIYSNDSTVRKIIYTFFIITMSFNIFISGGRAGQIAFIILAFIFSVLYFRKNKKILITFFLAIPISVTLIYMTNDAFKTRTNMTIKTLKTGSFTGGLGERIVYTLNTLDIIADNFIFGVGTGGFKTEYKKKKRLGAHATDQPHNQYLFAMAQQGIFGLGSLLYILYAMLRFSKEHEEDLMQKVRYIFVSFFAIIMLSDIYLYGFVTQSLFVYFGVILYKQFDNNPFTMQGIRK